MTAAGGTVEDGPAITHGLAAEVLYEGEDCDVDMGNATEAPMAAAAAGVRPTLPQEEWDNMTRKQRKNWMMQGGRLRRVSRHMGIRGTRSGAEPEPIA